MGVIRPARAFKAAGASGQTFHATLKGCDTFHVAAGRFAMKAEQPGAWELLE